MIEGKLGESSWRVLDKLLLEYQQRIDALDEYREARDREDAVRDKRIEKLVERLDRAYTKIHALERRTRGLGET